MYFHAYLGSPYAGGGSYRPSPAIEASIECAEIVATPRTLAAYAGFEDVVNPGRDGIEIPAAPPVRVLAQDILTGEWLDWELPLGNLEITYTLSGAQQISGEFAPEIQRVSDLGLEPWGTWIHVEDSGEIRASGILQPVDIDAEAERLSVTAIGFSGYADGIPYLGEYSRLNIDPWQVVADIWAHLQSYPDARLGVVIDPGWTHSRVGVERNNDGEVEPYELMWWDTPDCGKEIQDLAKECGFEFLERSYWNADKTDVEHHLVLGYPRHGNRRRDLRFAQGENLLEAATAAEPDDTYASEVIVTGSGEGKTMVRGTKSSRYKNRLRRVAVVEDETITTGTRASAIASETLREAQAALTEITEIVIDASHENARLGTFQCGDDILVGPVDIPYLGTVSLWHRITSYTYRPENDSVRLTLSRRDAVRGEIS